MIVSLEEWRRSRLSSQKDESGRRAHENVRLLGDEVVMRACSEVASGRPVEIHRLAAAVVLSGEVLPF